MNVITMRLQIRSLPERLKAQWQRANGTWLQIAQQQPDTEKIHAAVSALDLEKATPKEVIAAMGFHAWSWLDAVKCHECGREVDAVVQLGEEPNYENNTANICGECLELAMLKLRGVEDV